DGGAEQANTKTTTIKSGCIHDRSPNQAVRPYEQRPYSLSIGGLHERAVKPTAWGNDVQNTHVD
ncbi:MAG TPA: hypothetical protein PLV85_13900, partial [Polyangiaceae bacterium]|nr:hypothetical protein [Polyangiaceae bacterium]